MTVGTPKTGNVSAAVTTTPRGAAEEPDTEAVRLKAAGVGAVKAENPFDNYLPSYAQDAYEEEAKTAEQVKATKAAVSAGVPTSKATGKAQQLIDRAKSFVGTPYKWGGSGPLGFDCSGFTQYLFRELGINLPRISAQQGNFGKRVGVKELRPGDLVFWNNSSRNIGADHVAIYMGDGMVIHAPKPGDRVKISKIWDSGSAWGVAMDL